MLVCVYLLHNWQAYIGVKQAWNKVFLTAGEHWSNVRLSLFAAQYSDFTRLWISSSFFSEAFSNIPRSFTWSKNYTRTLFRQKFDGAGCLYFLGQKRTPIVLSQLKGDFVFISLVTTNIQKMLQSTNAGAEHTYITSKHQIIHSHIHPGFSIGMSFLWESRGKRPMGWDGTAHICISHETQK